MSNINFETLRNQICSMLKKITKSDDTFIFDMYLSAQGIDSLDMFDLLVSVQDTFNIDVDIENIEEEEWSTINKITSNIENLLLQKNESNM